MSIGTKLFTWLRGREVGRDAIGNIYYEDKKTRPDALRQRRWVMFAGGEEASFVPPEWHSWLHYTTDVPIPETDRRPWQLPHEPNLTGTGAGYRPPGHDYRAGAVRPANGGYESWSPGS